MGDTAGPERFVGASRTLLDALMLKNATLVPDEMQRVQELVECVENNAQKIAAALAANRRRGASVSGADTTAQLVKEQKQFTAQVSGCMEDYTTEETNVGAWLFAFTQIEELFEQLSNKPTPNLQAEE
jgi:hypothetical protein